MTTVGIELPETMAQAVRDAEFLMPQPVCPDPDDDRPQLPKARQRLVTERLQTVLDLTANR